MNSKEINKFILAVLFCLFTLNTALPQVAINTDGAQPHEKSILDVASTTLGVLLPRMTEVQRNLITSPPQGLLVFQIDGGVNAGLYYATGVGNNWTLIFHSNTTAITGNGSTNYIPYWTGTNALAFTGMYWDNINGRLGIGTTNPGANLDIAGNSAFLGFAVSTDAVSLDLGQSRTGNGYAFIDLHGDATYSDYGLRIIRDNQGPNSISNLDHRGTGSLSLTTKDAGPIDFLTTSTNRMRIAANGNVGIGTTTPAYKLHVAGGTIRCELGSDGVSGAFLGGGSNLQIYHNATTTVHFWNSANGNYGFLNPAGTSSTGALFAASYTVNSDRRLKNNIVNTHFGINDLMKVQVRDYVYKSDSSKTLTTGFIAQELYDIFPNAVTKPAKEEDMWSVDYGKVTPLLVKAIQEQQNKIDDLETRLSKLERNNQTADNASFGGNISTTVIVLIIGIGVALFYYRKTYNNFNNKH